MAPLSGTINGTISGTDAFVPHSDLSSVDLKEVLWKLRLLLDAGCKDWDLPLKELTTNYKLHSLTQEMLCCPG